MKPVLRFGLDQTQVAVGPAKKHVDGVGRGVAEDDECTLIRVDLERGLVDRHRLYGISACSNDPNLAVASDRHRSGSSGTRLFHRERWCAGPRRGHDLAPPLGPSALELLDLVLELLRGGSKRRGEITSCRGSVKEVLAARVEGHLHLMP